MVQTIFPKSSVNDVKIFSTTQLSISIEFISHGFNSGYVLGYDVCLIHHQPFKLISKSLKSNLVYSIILFICLLQYLPYFSSICSVCYLLKVRLTHSLVQHVHSCFVLYLRISQCSNLGNCLFFIVYRLLIPILNYTPHVLGTKKSLHFVKSNYHTVEQGDTICKVNHLTISFSNTQSFHSDT